MRVNCMIYLARWHRLFPLGFVVIRTSDLPLVTPMLITAIHKTVYSFFSRTDRSINQLEILINVSVIVIAIFLDWNLLLINFLFFICILLNFFLILNVNLKFSMWNLAVWYLYTISHLNRKRNWLGKKNI